MYEHPQYLTPNGFFRKRSNPTKSFITKSKKNSALIAKPKVKKSGRRGISDEAAKLIAEAIRSMLRS